MRGFAVVAMLAAGASCGGTAVKVASATRIQFAPARDWTQAAAGRSAIAANVPLRDGPGVPHADLTTRDLPSTGIVVTASLLEGRAAFSERTLPLRLSDADVRHSFEGQVNADVPEYVLWRSVDGVDVDVRIFFGTQQPDAATLAAAQAALERLVLS
jgi:hypothetical protein